MAERNEQVMQMVSDELSRDPGIKLDELYEKAQQVDPAISQLSKRQFHGAYPLQVKRAQGRGEAGDSRRPAKKRGRGGKQASKQGGRRAARAAAEPPAADAAPARAGRGAAARSAGSQDEREAIRGIFLEFASAFSQAETKPDIVRVLSGLDGYVQRVEQLFGK